MIDLGLSKLAMIGVVALVVIGPEKLPRVARMAGTLYGRAQRYINQVKAEVGREIELDELRQMHKDVKQAASDVEHSIAKTVSDAESSVQGAWSEAQSAYSGSDGQTDSALIASPMVEQASIKVKNFRRKKLARSSAIPTWFKHQNGRKSRVLSGAARVARFRPGSAPAARSFH
jgi:sec-independent protein translocase protein TatB